jgi:hypothetical protein
VIPLAALIVFATVTTTAAPRDDHFVAFRFGSESQDNGLNDLEIFVEKLQFVYFCGQRLNSKKEAPPGASSAAYMVSTMLEVRAMSEQRADLRRLGRRQSAELQRIKDALDALPFGYHRGVLQELVDYFGRPESRRELMRLKLLALTGQLGQDPKERMFDDDRPASAESPPAAGR